MMNNEKTDVVVVGSGPAGSVLAARLAEVNGLKITLLEAGPNDNHPFIHIPAGFIKMIFKSKYIWPFTTIPTANTGQRPIEVMQGKVVGGSASINGLIYNRGLPTDFDHWAELGNKGWDYQSVLPYFMKSEGFTGTGDNELHGRDGAGKVSSNKWIHPACEAFIDGASELGLNRNHDYNGRVQEGVGYFQRIIHGRRRITPAMAFLKPALKKHSNLRLETNAQVTKILFDGKRAIGVEYKKGSKTCQLMANKQVVISAGTVNTAKLLQLSGIGKGADLQQLGLPVIHDLQGVGSNLRDHYSCRVVCKLKNINTINELARGTQLMGQIARWVLGKPSIITLSPSVVHIFAKSRSELSMPDLQGVFSPASYREGFVGLLDDYPGMTCGFWKHRPKSTGYIKLKSTNPEDLPLIQPNYLGEDSDKEVLLAGVKLARQLVKTGPLQKYFDHENLPGKDVQSDDELLHFISQYGVSSWHLIGTAKMGPAEDVNAVVSDRLSVHGIENLRIADASVMPTSPSANTYASCLMIGEKAADFIKQDLK